MSNLKKASNFKRKSYHENKQIQISAFDIYILKFIRRLLFGI